MSSPGAFASNRYIRSLIGVGQESNREKALYSVLLVSSVFFALASGYTTFAGLSLYIPWPFALFATIGINGLLWAASWRIGVMLFAEKFKVSLPIIFAITLTISVFFSYSALLDRIYDKPSRERDELRRSKINAEKLTDQLTQLVSVKSDYNNSANQIRVNLDNWYSNTVQAYSGRVNTLREELNRNKGKYNRYTERLERLKQQESNPNRDQSIIRNESAQQNVLTNKILPVEPQLGRIDAAKAEFDEAYTKLLKDNTTLSIENLGNMASAYKKYVSELTMKSPLQITEIPQEASTSIGELDQVNKFLAWQGNNLGISKKQTLEEMRQALFEFADRLPKSIKNNEENDAAVQKLLVQIDTIGKYGGQDVHPFVLALGELGNGNYLATGSLTIALAIDGLVLLCGLLGARPSSFLTMRRTEDLDGALDFGLAAIMSLNVKDRKLTGNPLIDRIVKILNLCEPDIGATAKAAIPATISVEKIKSEGLSQEIGIFLASGLAQSHVRENKIGLKLRLILWMADQVYRFDKGEQTAKEFRDIHEGN